MNNKTEKKKRKFLSDEEKMEIIKLHHLEGVSQCEMFGIEIRKKAGTGQSKCEKSSGSRSE